MNGYAVLRLHYCFASQITHSAQDDSTTLVHTLAVLRHYFYVVERSGVDIDRNPPRAVRACDEYLPLALLFAEAEEICLIMYLKIQQFFVPPEKSATDLTDDSASCTPWRSLPIR